MVTSKYIVPQESTEMLHEIFQPFTEYPTHQEIHTPEPNIEPDRFSFDHDHLQQEIEQIKQEIEHLNSTKKALQQELTNFEEKKNQYQKEYENIKTQAEIEAKKIIEDNQKQAQSILADAQKQKEIIEAETQKNKEQFIQENREIGYQEGFAEGYKKGEREREEIEVYLKKILNETIRKKDHVVESIRQHLVDLVYTAVEKVVKKISIADKKVVLNNIVDALRKIDDPVKLIIKVSYDDLKASTMFKSRLLSSLKTLQQVEVIADPSVEVGGCIVETEFTIVDSRISTQLDKIGIALHSLDVTKSQPH